MTNSPPSSNESPVPLSAWPSTSHPKRQSAQRSRPSSRPRHTSATTKSGKKWNKRLNRRERLLRQLEIDLDVLASSPQITPLLNQNGIKADRVVEVLRCDDQPDSLTFVRKWDSLTPSSRSIAGIEVIALAAGLTPRRLWELFQGASLVQAKQSVSVLLAESLPEIMQTAIRGAKLAKGLA